METDSSEIIGYAALGLVIWSFILYALISGGARSATRDMSYNIKMIHRLLILKLRISGVSKRKLVEMHNQTTDEFWASIEEDKEDQDHEEKNQN